MTQIIGKIIATEKSPSTVDDFYFWTQKDLILNPFDVVKYRTLLQNAIEVTTKFAPADDGNFFILPRVTFLLVFS